MRLISISTAAVAAALAFVMPAMAERTPRTMGQDARVRSVPYSTSDVIRVDTHLRVNTAVELGTGERIGQVLLGDSESFEVEVLSNRHTVSVKPVIAGASTNMIIYTDRRAVTFHLTEGRTRTQTFRVVVDMPRTGPAASAVRPGGPRDTGYQYSRNSSIRPVQVWNDGTNTFFEFAGSVRPSVFALDARGYEITQNSQTRGSVVKVNGVRDDYTIRIGDEFVCIRRVTGGTTTAIATVEALRAREF